MNRRHFCRVENNVVVTDHWHGITLLGARNSSITNNTVIDLNQDRPGPPWISIDNHKDCTAPTGCVVRNNLTTALNNFEQVVEESNITFAMDESATFFVEPLSFDLHLRKGAPAVDTGTATSAPDPDRDRIPRPQREGVDLGAYEWHDARGTCIDSKDSLTWCATPSRRLRTSSKGRTGRRRSAQSGVSRR